MSSSSIPLILIVGLTAPSAFSAAGERAADGDFVPYIYSGTFELPQPNCAFDVLPDGRIIALAGDQLYAERAVGSRTYEDPDTLPNAELVMPDDFWPAFIRVSPDGSRIAVGNNGGPPPYLYKVAIFNYPDLDDDDYPIGHWFEINHWDAQWYDNTTLAVSAQGEGATSVVTILDVSAPGEEPVNTTVISNIGGYPAGVTFDSAGNLYTGNGYATGGPSATGAVKAFPNHAWTAALNEGPVLDFEDPQDGTLVTDILSAAHLGFDAGGHLHVGGGDVYGTPPELNYAAVVRCSAVESALAGEGEVLPGDQQNVWQVDPDNPNSNNQYVVITNPITHELYLVNYLLAIDTTAYAYRAAYAVPAVSHWGLAVMSLLVLSAGTLVFRRRGGGLRVRVPAWDGRGIAQSRSVSGRR